MRLIADSIGMTVGTRALFSGLSFSVRSGEIAALMGPSGAGKSTLLAGIASLAPLSSGSMRHEPASGDEADPKGAERIHWMFQSSPLLSRRSALENVALAHELRGVLRADALEQSLATLTSLGLDDVAEQPVHRLSGGERQRVAVARALAAGPALLLADEPTASLDADSRAVVTEALLAVARNGSTVIVATHDRWVADRCDQIIELHGNGPNDVYSGKIRTYSEVVGQ